MTNYDKLRELIQDILLLEPGEYSLGLGRGDVPTWDSLAVVSIAVGLDETFGQHPSPDEATGLKSVADIVAFLESRGLSFSD
ncbi:acyl carrier protein [uncultured Thiodictyon sp.]|uniref:acyl carrier protein n=1 Tax=uncultured Thiodictyon sp. TaxID=1846217 RepID=UPI0025E88B36|nr:acyl carrier protein [uncultured Thiodictyon sp.]